MTIARQSSGLLRRGHQRERGLLRCLLATVHPERGLSRVLVQHLARELPGVAFTLLPDTPELDTVWLCGFEPGAAALVTRVRGRHPRSHLLVSGRRPTGAWAETAFAAGADAVCGWPVSLAQIEALLRGGRPR